MTIGHAHAIRKADNDTIGWLEGEHERRC